MERLDKVISNTNSYSRSEIKKMIKSGRVTVNGKIIKDSAYKVDGNSDVITVDSVELFTNKFVYIMQNKPKGVVSASEGKGDTTVVDLLPDEMKRDGLFPAGRLDKDTTGFVLITNDGEFAHRILSPKNHIEKTYEVMLDKPVTSEGVVILENGLELKDGTVFKPAKLKKLNENNTKFEIVIYEGKYHQIKRMFKAVGSTVIELNRIKMGNLYLDSKLEKGSSRYLTEEELGKISQIDD